MKRERRGKKIEGLGSVESWEFGYLYQGRSWAKNPSPSTPRGWPLSWVKQVITFPESKLNELRGLDAAVYSLFLRACTRFVLLHTFTTVPILLPIHLHFSDDSVSPRSMTRASISSLVGTAKGRDLLWIHVILLFYVTISWVATLVWISRGAFRYRHMQIQSAADRAASVAQAEKDSQYHPHPHPQYPFQSLPVLDDDRSNRGLRLRTIMVTNIPSHLRSEKEFSDYLEYYLSRPSTIPSVALSSRPGFFNKLTTLVYNRTKRVLEHMHHLHRTGLPSEDDINTVLEPDPNKIPVISRVVIARKMTELASLLERREGILQKLEVAHVKLAQKTLNAVTQELDKRKGRHAPETRGSSFFRRRDDEEIPLSMAVNDEKIRERLIRSLQPFVEEFGLSSSSTTAKLPDLSSPRYETVWEALHSLPRSCLHGYQPLIRLSSFFRGHTVPEIDYFTAKLNLLTTLITENRARAIEHYVPVSTAFVTFADPKDARRACRYLASHPNNPISCIVQMAPSFEDLDWIRIMKSTFKAEVTDFTHRVFTLAWLFPVSLFVGLVSIQNISAYWPSLANYLSRHPWEEELLQSFLPTVLVSLLTLLIPLILFLIAKKAHTIITLSALHDRIMTRYYKFLIVNILVFFCIGTAALQSFLVGFAIKEANRNALHILSDSFPSAGPFYVGWLIFTTAIHGGVELALFVTKLPLIMYPSTRRAITPRERSVGIRPRTFNYYYWLPNHLLVIHVLFVFAVLNPLVMPFGLIYFSIGKIVVKNQFLHVYAKNYEGNGQMILVRLIRYSLDGLMLAQAVFLAYMAVLRKEANLALTAVLIVLTALAKIVMTRVCRAKFERDDLNEAMIVCGTQHIQPHDVEAQSSHSDHHGRKSDNANVEHRSIKQSRIWATWRVPRTFPFSYATSPRAHRNTQRRPIPFENTGSLYSPVRSESPQVTEYRVGNIGRLKDVKRSSNNSLVSPRPPHPRWDDASDPDHPYDNPYYIRPIGNTLWLPRNPCGLLNLDDTVDLSTALTSTENSGVLGSWLVGSQRSPLPDLPPDSQTSPLRGNEDIVLPPPMASRIHSKDIEEVSQPKLHPSAKIRRRSTGYSNHGTTTTSSSRPRFASFLTVGNPHYGSPPRSESLPTGRRRKRLAPLDPGLVDVADVLPDEQGQMELLASVQLQPNEDVRESSSVSPAEAVTQEVIVEERVVAEERMRQEEEESEESMREHSWWMRWLFSRTATRSVVA
ncbi:hypothetical protein B0F90DRAFT_1809149 [Multifurca ochricompacta]|uniref:DUF221-domain-containing protein n=1 Tax=Multifurca ochricompacta TaxID=376703 RepID=A0AAD4QQ43_9AGAM|nr:hypothetical protein B0F90DRAFT_1809149 [Multifurca ochricompacta]